MAIIENGEKYACDACVKGHRVSSCQHKDRPLQHINRKGRPVSQCQHCRGLRRNRSAHVKCVCAEIGLKRDRSRDRSVGSVDSSRCTCMYGMPCTCALKREALDSDDLSRLATHNNFTHRRAYSYNNPKPLAANRRSDSHVANIRGAHHSHLHRPYHAHHERGLPYNVGRFSRSTGNFDLQQQLPLDSAPPTSSPVYHPQNPDMSSLITPRRNNFVRSEVNSPAPPSTVSSNADGWSRPMESSFMTAVASPNPARHSLNDFSKLSSWDYLNNPYVQDQPPASAGADQYQMHLQQQFGTLDQLNGYNNSNSNFSEPDLQRSSFISNLEQPGLSHSPSASASDTGESAVNFGENGYTGLPQYPQKDSDQLWPVHDYGESPISEYPTQAYSATSTPFVYSASDNGYPGFGDYMGGPGPATSPDNKQDPSSPISFALDPPAPDYNNTATAPITTAEYAPSSQSMQPTMSPIGMAISPSAGYGSEADFRASPIPTTTTSATGAASPYALA